MPPPFVPRFSPIGAPRELEELFVLAALLVARSGRMQEDAIELSMRCRSIVDRCGVALELARRTTVQVNSIRLLP